MEQYKRISKQIGFSYFMQGMSFIISFFFFAVLTRLLTTSDYGIYAILAATLVMLSRILALGLSHFIIRDIPGRPIKEKRKRISIMLNFITLFLLIFLGILSAVKLPLLKYFKLSPHSFVFQLIILIVFFSVLSKFIGAYLVANKRIIENKLLSFFSLELWGLLAIVYGLYQKSITLNQVFLIRFFVISIVFIFIFKYIKKKGVDILSPWVFNLSYIKKALKFSLPLMPVAAIAWIITASDRYILGFFHGSIKVGMYSYVYSLFSFVLTVGMIISATLLPYIVEAWNKKSKERVNFLFNASIKYILLIVVPAVFGLFAMRKEIITLISGLKYLPALPIVPILMFFPILHLMNGVYQYTLILKNRTKTIGLIYVIGLVFNIILNFILIPPFHFYGASVATILTYLFMFSLFYRQGRRLIKLDNNFIKAERILFSALLMCLAIFFIHPKIVYTKLLVMTLGAAIYFILLLLLKGFVKDEINLVKSLFEGKLRLLKRSRNS